jgi:hypothetical protein
MKILGTIALSFVAFIASLSCLLSSICAVSGGSSASGRAAFAFTALVFLGIAIGAVMLIGQLNRKP